MKAEFIVAGLVHDIGKILMLTDEDMANIVCCNTPIGTAWQPGIGFDNIKFQWNHDEYGGLPKNGSVRPRGYVTFFAPPFS